MTAFRSYVAIGDSFTEGMGDVHPDGGERGWADLVALGLALAASPEPVRYANLAIRGRKLGPLIEEQLDAALAMRPELVSINGGGNDMLRPRMGVERVAAVLLDAVRRAVDAGSHVLLLAGADPSEHLPFGALVRRRGRELTAAVRGRLGEFPPGAITFVDNFGDELLHGPGFWSPDGLHMNARGHHRVAQNVLRGLGLPVPPAYQAVIDAELPAADYGSLAYYREYVLPWFGRRLTGRSSGDGRVAKRPDLEPVRIP